MNTSLEYLPEHKQKQLREITGIIVRAVDPEKVILFGSHATGRWVEHRYTEGGIKYFGEPSVHKKLKASFVLFGALRKK